METISLDQVELLFFVLVGLAVLIVVALVVYVLSANRRQRAKMVQVHEEDRFTPRPALLVSGQVLSLHRDEPGGALLVKVNDQLYRRLSEIEDPQIKREVIEAAMELVQFTGVLGSDVSGPAPLDKTYSWREDVRQGSRAELDRAQAAAPVSGAKRAAPETAGKDVEERFLNLLSEMGQTPGPEKPTLAASVQHLRSRPGRREQQPRSFVDDIEDIVQRRLQFVPALTNRDLHVRPGPGGAVRFVFEGRDYESVDEIPNMTARQLVKDAIQEWDETA